ncbi:PREDICTED: probable disease resistance protein At4g27220 [Ipomoea nil]|uniref:probable disease resistance protein At4g27220 n=1 Tax=Ipomoea nil TaxID=35883 RepID=UPI000900B55C|nr:PREDICTED: probable disease resistance protein At4g27220 [Ipomoea nil]
MALLQILTAIVGPTVTELYRLLQFESICARIKNVRKIRSNYKDLETKKELLSALQSRLRKDLDDDQVRHRLPTTQVQDWLSRVEKLENHFNSVTKSGITTSDASCCYCVSSVHWKLSNEIVRQIQEAKQLIEKGESYENATALTRGPIPRPVQETGVVLIDDQSTGGRNLDKLMDLLKRKECKRIGVWGMGGVGKTTLVKNLNNQLSKPPKNKLFTMVILVEVSRNASLESVQSKIAKRLFLQISEGESKESVASHLYNKLKGENFLLILDNVWEKIDLDAVGIPHSGSKIILTTREFNVCQQMWIDTNLEMRCLSPDEAWELFSQRVGKEVVNDEQINPLAKAIVRRCDGLPLAVTIIGASLMKKRQISLWKNALAALEKSEPVHLHGVEEDVYKKLKWSYDSLQSEQLKSCFLFFCLFPEHYEVDIYRLVQYWLAEGLLDEKLNYEELHNSCCGIVESLKDSCLLEEGSSTNTVKMHDVVRDVGIWIASATTSLDQDYGCKSSFICTGVGRTHGSQTQLWNGFNNRVNRVSFMNNNLEKLPDYKVQCLETSTLFLQGNKSLEVVPCSFLEGFQKLKVLDLSSTKIKSLPHSLLQLGELRALILRGCNELSELPCLASLGALQVLDCSGSAITKLPDDFEELTNLRQLDLSRTRMLQKFPTNKISKLHSLEYLNMTDSATKWGMRITNEENVPLEELLCLERVISVYIDLKCIPRVTREGVSRLKGIKNFTINVIDEIPDHWFSVYTPYQHNTKSVSFNYVSFSRDEPVGWLLKYAFDCKIMYCQGVDLMLGNLNPCVNLKCLCLAGCYISFKPSSHHHHHHQLGCDVMPNLEKLILHRLTGLKSLSDFSNFLGLRFTKLKHIDVLECYDLENLLAMDNTLQKLEEVKVIRIRVCWELTQVFKNACVDNFVPKLESLELTRLESLGEICKADVSTWQNLKHLDVTECNKLWKLPLGIQNGQGVLCISGEQEWWEQLQWDCKNFKMRLQSHFKRC